VKFGENPTLSRNGKVNAKSDPSIPFYLTRGGLMKHRAQIPIYIIPDTVLRKIAA
jgi:hypothetical protein